MQKVYAHPDIGMVHLAKNALANHGIEAIIKGEHLASVAGGGSAWNEAWVELWVEDDAQAHEAARIIDEATLPDGATDDAPWTCPSCVETVEAQFAVCWNCGHEQPEAST